MKLKEVALLLLSCDNNYFLFLVCCGGGEERDGWGGGRGRSQRRLSGGRLEGFHKRLKKKKAQTVSFNRLLNQQSPGIQCTQGT